MSKEWVKGTLGSVCEIQSGAGFPDKLQGQVGQKYPFYKVSDMNLPGNEIFMASENNSVSEATRKQLHARVFPKGSVIFPKVGGAIATNKKRIVLKNCCVDNNVMGLIPKVGHIDPDYLFYFMESVSIYEFSNKAALPSIRQSTVDAWEIKYPRSVDEQRRIVAILDEVFNGIGTAASNAERNLTNARGMFDNYVYTNFCSNSNGWLKTTLGALCDGVEYGTATKSLPEGQVPVLRMGNIQKGNLDWSNLVYTDDDEEVEKYLLKPGDVLFNRTNSAEHVGKAAIYRGGEAAIFAGYLIRVRYKKEYLDGEFLNYFLNSSIARDYGKSVMSQSVNQANISGSKLKEYPIAIPPLSKQREIAANLHRLQAYTSDLAVNYLRKLEELQKLKQAILEGVLAGQLAVQPERRLQEAVA